MSDVEIERCVCGAEARLVYDGAAYYIDCPVYDMSPYPRHTCWIGPSCNTADDALAAWNTIMRAARERARLLEEVVESHVLIVGEWGGVETPSGEYSGEYPFARCTCPDCTEHRARGKEKSE